MCSSTLCMAVLLLPDCRQSVDKAPLVTVAKAKLAAVMIQLTEGGAEKFTLPRSVMYCSHSVSACKTARHHCQCQNQFQTRLKTSLCRCQPVL